MRRILLLITDLKIGGTPTVVRELAVRLHQPPHVHVEVACLSPWGPVADQLAAAGVAVTALDAAGVRDVLVVRRLTRLIRRQQIDTVFSFLVHANAIAAAASLLCRGVRFLQSIQTTQPEPRWHWWVQRLVQHAAEKVVVPSESIAQVAAEWADVPPEKIVLVPNAIDPEAFRLERTPDAAPPAEAGYEPGEGPRRYTGGSPSHATGERGVPHPIGFIGRLDPIKRIPDLLEAVRQLHGRVHLHLFGEGAERPAIEAEISRLGIASHVTMHGAIARPQEALKQIELLVLPSAAEGFGLVLIEAMAAGIPVVATDVPGIRNVVRDGQTGLLVPPAQPPALAQAITRLLDDLPLRQRLVDQASLDVRQRFTWAQILPQYESLLRLPSPNPQSAIHNPQ